MSSSFLSVTYLSLKVNCRISSAHSLFASTYCTVSLAAALSHSSVPQVECLEQPTRQQLQEQMCAACEMPPGELERQIRVAPCGHWFHDSCLKHSFDGLCYRCPVDHRTMFAGLAIFKKKAKVKAADGEGSAAEESVVVDSGMLQLCGTGIHGASTGVIAPPERSSMHIKPKTRTAASAQGATRSSGKHAAANSTATSSRRVWQGRAAPRADAESRQQSAPLEQTPKERTASVPGHRFKSTNRKAGPPQRRRSVEPVEESVDVSGLAIAAGPVGIVQDATNDGGARGMRDRMGSVRGVGRHKAAQKRKDKLCKSKQKQTADDDGEVDVSGLTIGGTQLFLPTISSAPCSRDGR